MVNARGINYTSHALSSVPPDLPVSPLECKLFKNRLGFLSSPVPVRVLNLQEIVSKCLWNEWIRQLIKCRVKEKDRQSGCILNMGMSWSSSTIADIYPEGTFRLHIVDSPQLLPSFRLILFLRFLCQNHARCCEGCRNGFVEMVLKPGRPKSSYPSNYSMGGQLGVL